MDMDVVKKETKQGRDKMEYMSEKHEKLLSTFLHFQLHTVTGMSE